MSEKIEKVFYPVVKCLPRPDFLGGLMFWCPWCECFHRHGRGEGHRVSHCDHTKNSPIYEHGYILTPYTKKELREIRDAIQQELDNPWYHRGKLIERSLTEVTELEHRST